MKQLVFLLFIIPHFIHAQDSIQTVIDSTVVLKPNKGVYRTSKEFISDSPGLKLNYTIKHRSQSDIVLWGGSEYEVKFPDDVKKRFIKDSIWGINTGEVILINNNTVATNRGFVRLLKIDYPYSFFIARVMTRDESADAAMYAGGAIGGAFSSIPYERVVAIDMNDGRLIRLNDYGMSKILENDKDLFEKYKSLKYRNDKEVVIEFIEIVNKRH